MKLTSPAFGPLGRIPNRYAGDGEDRSPPLEWSGAPAATKQFAVVVHDPDAPMPDGYTHWVVYGIPPSATSLREALGPDSFVPGVNDSGSPGYTGPYPPTGHGVHHYYFWLYALDIVRELKKVMKRGELIREIEGHILEQARLVGTYER